MNYILFDDSSWSNLLPLTFTRPVSEVRVGILTITEKWEKYLSVKPSFLTQDYLAEKYSLKVSEDNILINGSVFPHAALLSEINTLKTNQLLKKGEVVIAARMDAAEVSKHNGTFLGDVKELQTAMNITKIEYPWQLFSFNETAIKEDFELITKGRKSAPISSTNKVLGAGNIFLEPGAVVECATLNAQTGPIYIGKDAEIMEGAMVRGALALCEHSTIKMGAKIYGATTIGPHSKFGGEISNSVVFGYSNKAHDGFLGNSVLGEWCNLGADTNNSNLKNNYAEVRVWNYNQDRFVSTGLQFCGLIMGDHSKSGINTMFNTGTVIGVSSNIFGDGFPRNFVPSFAWGGAQGFTVYAINKAFEVAELVLKRRGLVFTEADKKILNNVFELTEKYRRF